jgi:anti-sigma factor RsiW
VSCREFLSLFLDVRCAGELGQWRRTATTAHLAACTACRGYAADYRAVVDALRTIADDAPAAALPALPEALVQRVLAAARSR